MVLIKAENLIGSITRRKNLFVLNTQTCDNKAMLIKGRRRLIYLLSKNSQIRLWHRWIEHISNTRVMEASKHTDDIDITIDKNL